ncbi:HupE/UreJ family protein [Demequina lignilytica]|uniref:HupE/UreJ family protein n=1 Tax=Demequina lignilytica TaxID=3051663 RepID=A0AB35MGC7_9MICO|nr:HupE/UreJ family protein [Demequina sp. SYSU T0a273]MDN4482818.1 HupE/UreJ family protein [Demequina sp. SYSU T0a273]
MTASTTGAAHRPLRATMRGLAALVLAAAAMVGLGAGAAEAHPAETTAVLVSIDEGSVELELQVPVRQYNAATSSDLDVDGADVEARADELAAYVLDRLEVADADGALDLSVSAVAETTVNDLPTADIVVIATAADGSVDGDVAIEYGVLIDTLATHEVYVSLVSDWEGGTLTDEEPELVTVLDWEHTTAQVSRDDGGWAEGLWATVRLGASHIAAGPDHVLFLVLLLLPAPLVAVGRRWVPRQATLRETAGAAARRAATLVTSFTAGHTISLALVSLGLISLPTVVTESLVALSVVAAAAHAMVPALRRGEAWTAGLFGIVHGTAFATTLVALDLPLGRLIAAIVGFNVGVELAQLVVVAALLPALVWAARSRWFAGLRWAVAAAGAVAGAAWLVGVVRGEASVLGAAFDAIIAHPWQAYAVALATLAVVSAGPRVRQSSAPVREASRPTAETVVAR